MARDFPLKNQQLFDKLRQSKPRKDVATTAKCELFKYVDPDHPGRILAGFYKQWRDGLYLDVTIVVDGISVKAHKSVLSAFSQYFQALFNSNMSDSGLDVIRLQDVNGKAVEMLIGFAYSGMLDITPDNVQDLLYAANFLCIDSVINACCVYLQDHLSVENCIDIGELAVTLGQVTLKQKVEIFMISNFEVLLHSSHFPKMHHEVLVEILKSDKMIVLETSFCRPQDQQEEKIIEAILQFVEAAPEVHHQHLPVLLSCGVRLLLLPKAKILELKCRKWIESSPDCLKLLDRILSSEISREERERWERPRQLTIQYEITRQLANTREVHSEEPTQPFDDHKLFGVRQYIFVTGMKIYLRLWDGRLVVGGMEVFYNTGQSVLHGSAGYGYENHEFFLSPDERIVSIDAQAGWMIDQLSFTTNRRNVFGPYGGFGGSKVQFTCSHDGAYLAYIKGNVDVVSGETAVRKLQFVWGFAKCSSAYVSS